MSLINFLNPKLKPSVDCNGVCEDGYTAANLISENDEQLSRGLICYAVTKPPVEIVFDFPKAIDLKVIKLWNSIGSLRSTAFEVHGKYEGIWERVGFIRDLDKFDSITFCYQSDYNSRSNAEGVGAQQPNAKAFFFKSAHKMLSNTNSIKITIRSTIKCPPVLRKIQVWGLPSRTLEKAERELVKTIWNEITNPTNEPQSEQRSPSRSMPELTEESTLQLPEDFLDSITWELMIFPTVLPSGKVVDQSTIDKHSEVEAKWGRLPSDPFTGLEFTSQRKAILNLALKARIEKFLMENSQHFKNVPRSLGSSRVRRSKNRHASQFANLTCQSHNVGAYSTLLSSTNLSANAAVTGTGKYKAPTTSTITTSIVSNVSSVPVKRRKLSMDSAFPVSNHHTSTATQTTATVTGPCYASATSSVSSSSTGMNLAIQQALQKMTRYTLLPMEMSTPPASCIVCKSEDFAYEIRTCKHLVCRDCLVTISKQRICACKISFRSIDVERYHKL